MKKEKDDKINKKNEEVKKKYEEEKKKYDEEQKKWKKLCLKKLIQKVNFNVFSKNLYKKKIIFRNMISNFRNTKMRKT